MMTRSTRFPVDSFGSNLHAVLREGANKELRIKFLDDRIATRFIHRLNALRAAMKREAHPDWKRLYACGIHRDSTDRRIVLISPRDSEFIEAITEVGII